MSDLLTDEEIKRAIKPKPVITDSDRRLIKAQNAKTKKGLLADLVRVDGAEDLKTLEKRLTEYMLALKKEVEDG